MSLYLNHIAALSLNLTQPIQPRLPGFFESTPEINLTANEPTESSNIEMITPGQKSHAEPSAQANHHAPRPIPANHFADPVEQTQSTAPLQAHEPAPKPSINATANRQPEIPSQPVNAPQPKPTHETQNANLRMPEQNNNTPLFNKIEAVESIKPESIQPVTALKTKGEASVTQSEQRYKPTVERIIEHTLVERVLIGRDDNISPTPTNHKDSTEITKPSIFDKPKQNVAADLPVAPPITQQTPVADLKPANTVIAHEKFVLEPRIQVRTPAKETQKTEALNVSHTEPTIQVSIGRIEIRATQNTDKNPAKPRSANNALSLDDYLKQRNGGRS